MTDLTTVTNLSQTQRLLVLDPVPFWSGLDNAVHQTPLKHSANTSRTSFLGDVYRCENGRTHQTEHTGLYGMACASASRS